MHQCPIFFRFDVPGALAVVDRTIGAWFTELGWGDRVPAPGERITLDASTHAVHVARVDRGTGRRSRRFTLACRGGDRQADRKPGPAPGGGPRTGNTDSGPRTTTITLDVDRFGRRGWVLVREETEAPPTRTPRIAAALASALGARDGAHPLTQGAPIVQTPDVPDLIGLLCDPGRTRPLLVVGTDHGFPVRKLADLVAALAADAEALLVARVLDAPATAQFNQAVPDALRVGPGTGAVFPPPESLASEGHAAPEAVEGGFPARHSVIGADRMVSDEYGLRRELWHLALHYARANPLPTAVEEADARLGRLTDRCREAQPAPEPATPAPPKPGAHVAPAEKTPHAPAGAQPGGPLGPLGSLLGDILEDVLGDRTIDTDSLENLRVVARRGNRRTREHRRDRGEIRRLRHELAAAHRTIDSLRTEQDPAAPDPAPIRRNSPAQDTRPAQAHRPQRGHDHAPDTFAELLDRLAEVPRVQFTGDPQPALRLDRQSNSRGYVHKTWKALLALSDYAEARSSDCGPPGVHNYLTHTPPGCRGFSVHDHAAVESDTTTRAAAFREPRVLPVPESVHPDGAVFMGGHFRVGGGSTVSPRLHYYDDTGSSGDIYVGYIGAHLPNQSTN
ncbi:hypothetical protein [Tomitella fengzijianii]|uniref:Uncharacterized protein n=1 Tax=Tomitella fengzijianii TaxID=2597660 RepID=A0A516X225_9ACTN|nr:hypothetical protein [Tomitella fengzijianii]QDQ97103.1 hypothetical protein FO059_06865 [Tomitella fengzijianii]